MYFDHLTYLKRYGGLALFQPTITKCSTKPVNHFIKKKLHADCSGNQKDSLL